MGCKNYTNFFIIWFITLNINLLLVPIFREMINSVINVQIQKRGHRLNSFFSTDKVLAVNNFILN